MWDCEGLGCKTANLLESHPGMRRAPSPQLILPMLPTCKSSLVLSSTWHDAKRMMFTDVLEIQSSTHCPVEASVGNSDVPLQNSPSAFIHRWSSCQKGISTTDFPIPYFWSIQLFIPLLWISVVGEGIRKEVLVGDGQNHQQKTNSAGRADILVTWTDHKGRMKNPRARHFWNSCRSLHVGHYTPLLSKLLWDRSVTWSCTGDH